MKNLPRCARAKRSMSAETELASARPVRSFVNSSFLFNLLH